MNLCGSIARADEKAGLIERRRSIGLSESVMVETTGIFEVRTDLFRNPLDLLLHQGGDLVDSDIVAAPASFKG